MNQFESKKVYMEQTVSSKSPFSSLPLSTPDTIFALTARYKERRDRGEEVFNLGVGVYQDENGETPELECVKKAKTLIPPPGGYLPIEGDAEYNRQVMELMVGEDSDALREGRVVTVQSLGGTGALMLGAALIKKAGFGGGVIFVPDPTWGNHHQIFEEHGFKVESYPYYRSDTRRADSKAAKAFFEGLCQNSVVLLHTVCHNPTGADFSMKEWRDIAEIFRERRLVPFFDFAYQGFKEGIEADREPMKLFIENGCYVLIASSFSKNASLYSKRTGALTVVAGSEGEASKVEGALKRVARTRYSNPPSDGALIVREILRSDELRKLWEEEVSQMRERIKETRRRFALELKKLGLDGSFVTDQHGIFSYTPLTPSEVQELEERGVFMLPSGRISIAGLNIRNIPTVAKHIAEVSKGWPKI